MIGDIKIRPVSIMDTDRILEIYAPYVRDTAVSFETEVPGRDEFSERIKKIIKKYPYLVAEMDGRIVGYAYAGVFKNRAAYDHCVETTIYLDKDMKRAGIGSLLYEKLEEILGRMGVLNMNACIAYPAKEDEYLTMDSIHFHEKMGYRMVGRFHNSGYKFDRWYDMVWMEKLIGEHTSPQGNVVKFNEKLFK